VNDKLKWRQIFGLVDPERAPEAYNESSSGPHRAIDKRALLSVLSHTDAHNKIVEEQEMWGSHSKQLRFENKLPKRPKRKYNRRSRSRTRSRSRSRGQNHNYGSHNSHRSLVSHEPNGSQKRVINVVDDDDRWRPPTTFTDSEQKQPEHSQQSKSASKRSKSRSQEHRSRRRRRKQTEGSRSPDHSRSRHTRSESHERQRAIEKQRAFHEKLRVLAKDNARLKFNPLSASPIRRDGTSATVECVDDERWDHDGFCELYGQRSALLARKKRQARYKKFDWQLSDDEQCSSSSPSSSYDSDSDKDKETHKKHKKDKKDKKDKKLKKRKVKQSELNKKSSSS